MTRPTPLGGPTTPAGPTAADLQDPLPREQGLVASQEALERPGERQNHCNEPEADQRVAGHVEARHGAGALVCWLGTQLHEAQKGVLEGKGRVHVGAGDSSFS